MSDTLFPLPELFFYFIETIPSIISLLIPVNREFCKIINRHLDNLIKHKNIDELVFFFIEHDLVIGLKKIEYDFNDKHVIFSCNMESIRNILFFMNHPNIILATRQNRLKHCCGESGKYRIEGVILKLIKIFTEKNRGHDLIDILKPCNDNHKTLIVNEFLCAANDFFRNNMTKHTDSVLDFYSLFIHKYC